MGAGIRAGCTPFPAITLELVYHKVVAVLYGHLHLERENIISQLSLEGARSALLQPGALAWQGSFGSMRHGHVASTVACPYLLFGKEVSGEPALMLLHQKLIPNFWFGTSIPASSLLQTSQTQTSTAQLQFQEGQK